MIAWQQLELLFGMNLSERWLKERKVYKKELMSSSTDHLGFSATNDEMVYMLHRAILLSFGSKFKKIFNIHSSR